MRRNIEIDIPSTEIHLLRVSEGWKINYNKYEIDPGNLESEYDSRCLFTGGLLQLNHEKASMLIDLGWVPDISPDGHYLVSVIKDDDWGKSNRIIHIN
ncbi:hypothetical protein [Bacillus sp. NPDC077027]|uniref:hypothetical protein n=1 Tax=Bacillus sp. NPDC077027 TaxID=3390548 RepID=UPI003D0459E0